MSNEAIKQEQESRMQGPQPLVVQGTGDPAIDVPAVQFAVDNAVEDGKRVDLRGTFSFDRSVTIKNWAAIHGLDPSGKRAIIQGGQSPFVVDSSNQPVSITGVYFVSPKENAIFIRSVNGLTIRDCKIDTPIPVQAPVIPGAPAFNTAGGILGVSSVQGMVKEIAGNILIAGNELDVTDPAIVTSDPTARTFGIQLNLAGQSMQANVTISGNNAVKNVTAFGIILREIPGTASVRGNSIKMGSHGARLSSGDSFVSGIMCRGRGQYTIADNKIDCDYENSAGISLQSPSLSTPLKGATVDGNRIKMSTPSGASNGSESAGIALRRNCTSNTVSNNKIDGQARAVLSVVTGIVAGTKLSPSNNRFVDTDHKGFSAAQADIVVGTDVQNTEIERGTGGSIWDDGVNTTVKPAGHYVRVN